MKHLVALAFTHKKLSLDQIGELHIPIEKQRMFLSTFKKSINCDEILYLTTCNRVEFFLVFKTDSSFDENVCNALLDSFNSLQSKDKFHSSVEVFTGNEATEHLMSVAASVDSLIVGEREIITQVRNAYENCKNFRLTGDTIRLLIRSVIETAKKVYAQTSISQNPVSIVSLAFRELKKVNSDKNARILIVGAGTTNTTLSRFLLKFGYNNFTVFNRTLSNGQRLANEIGGKVFDLKKLSHYENGFDILITCTSSDTCVIDLKTYEKLLAKETTRKTIIDLAVPRDISEDILKIHPVNYISIDEMKSISDINLKIRKKELIQAKKIIHKGVSEYELMKKERAVEIAMKSVPSEVKKIKDFAINELYKEDVNKLDEKSRLLVEKIVGYMEKKYISVPMKMAKKIILSEIKENDL